MEDLAKRRQSVAENIIKSFNVDIEKGKKADVGEVRTWNGRKMQKQNDGTWKELKEKKTSSKEEETAEKRTPKQEESRSRQRMEDRGIKVSKESKLSDFDAWSGGEDTLNDLKQLQETKGKNILGSVESLIKEVYEGNPTKTEVNDFLWFERDYIAEHLGYDSYDDLLEDMSSDEEDEEENDGYDGPEEEGVTYDNETTLRNFDAWSGGRDTMEDLRKLEQKTGRNVFAELEYLMDDLFIDKTPSDTDINDFLWFERDFIAEQFGYDNYDELMEDIEDEE